MRHGGLDIGAVRAVSWDVDGTLYSTRRLASRFRLAIVTASLRGEARAAWHAAATLHRFRKRMEQVRASGGRLAPDDACIEQRLAIERRWIAPAIAALGARRGVIAALQACGSRFEKQVVLSDFESGHKLDSLGLADHFDAIYSGERLGSLKPSPNRSNGCFAISTCRPRAFCISVIVWKPMASVRQRPAAQPSFWVGISGPSQNSSRC